MRIICFLFLLFPFLFCQELNVSFKKRKNEWLFAMEGTFPHKRGVVYTEIFFDESPLPRSRERLLLRDNDFSLSYKLPQGKILSGVYTLKILYVDGKLNREYKYFFSLGNLYKQKKEQVAYYNFIREFINSADNFSENFDIDAGKIDKVPEEWLNFSVEYLNFKSQLEGISFPKVVAPYYAKNILQCKKILMLQHKIMKLSKDNHLSQKEKRNIKRYKKTIQYYLSHIEQDFVAFSKFNSQVVYKDLQLCKIVKIVLEKYIKQKSPHKQKTLNMMANYFSLELSQLNKRRDQYKQGIFTKKIYPHFSKLVDVLQMLVSKKLYILCLKNKLQIPKGIMLPHDTIKEIEKDFRNNVEKINEILQSIENKKIKEKQKIYDKYELLFTFYKENKKQIIAGDIEKTGIFREKLQSLEKEESLYKIMSRMLFYITKVVFFKKQDNIKSKIYRKKYLLSLEITENIFIKYLEKINK